MDHVGIKDSALFGWLGREGKVIEDECTITSEGKLNSSSSDHPIGHRETATAYTLEPLDGSANAQIIKRGEVLRATM